MTKKNALLLFIFVYLTIPLFDRNLYEISGVEQMELNKRYKYFSDEMGVFYTKNKVVRFYLNRVFPVANKYLYELSHLK